MEFNGMTEFLAKINNMKTTMLMHGEKFSTIPLTTHVNLKCVNNLIKKRFLKESLNKILNQINNKIYNLNFKILSFYVLILIVVRIIH